MVARDRLRRAGLHGVLGAAVTASVWLASGYVRGEPLDYTGAATFALTFGVVMFVLRLWRG